MELVAVATRDEVSRFVEGCDRTDTVLGRPVFSVSDRLRVFVTGVGRANAAAAVAIALERYDVSRVVSTGVAGALPGSSLAVGDTVVGTHAVHGDLGVETAEGFGGAEHLGFETSDGYYNTYPLEDLPAVDGERGGIATVATVSATDEAAERVANRTGALVETMETVAVAQVAHLAGVSVSAVVGVSNQTGEEREFDFAAGRDAVCDALEVLYA